MSKLRKLLLFLLLLLCIAAVVGYFAWQQTFKLPDRLIQQARGYARSFHDIDFDTESLKINFPDHTIRARNLKVMMPGQVPFMEAEELVIYLASGTGPLDLYFSRAAIEKIQVGKLRYDATAPQPQNRDERPQLPAVPAREVQIDGLTLNTLISKFDIPDFRAKFIRTRRNANLELAFDKSPLGGSARLVAMLGLQTGDARINLSWHENNFSSFVPLLYLSHLYGLNIMKGGAEISLNYKGNLAERLKAPAKNIVKLFNDELSGSLRLNDCGFSFRGVEGILSLGLTREQGRPWLGRAEADILGGSATARVELSPDRNSPRDFTAVVNARNIRPDKKLFDLWGVVLPEAGPARMDFAGDFTCRGGKLTGSGTTSVKNLLHQQQKIDNADFFWKIQENESLLLTSEIRSETGYLSASSTISLAAENKWQGISRGALKNVDLHKLRPFLGIPVSGLCSGPFTASFDLQNLASTTYDLRLELLDGKFFDFNPRRLSARIYGTGLTWALSNPIAEFDNGGQITVEGVVTSQKYAADIFIENVNLEAFSVPSKIVSGNATLKASVGGSLKEPEVRGSLLAQNLNIMGMPVDSFRSQLVIRDKILSLAPIAIKKSDDEALDGYFSVSLDNGQINSFRLSFQKLAVESIRVLFPQHLSEHVKSGYLSGNIRFNHHGGQNDWNFLVEGSRLNLADELIDSLYLEGNSLGSQIEIKNLFMRAFGGSINIAGRITGSNHFSCSIETEALRLEKIKNLAAIAPNLRGDITMQGGFEQNGDERKGSFTVFARDMKSKDRDFGNFGCETAIDNEKIRISSGEFDKLGIKISGEMEWQGRRPYKAALELRNVDLSFIPELYGVTTFDYGGLLATGKCDVNGDMASLTPDVINMELDTLRIQKDNDVIISNKPMQIIYQNNGFEVRSLELKYRQGILGVEGIFTPGKTAALMLTGNNFSVKAIGRLFDLPNWNYDGSLSAEARLFGDFNDLRLKASATIAEFMIGGKKIPEVRARVEGNRNALNIEEAFIRLNSSSFNLKGNMTFKEDFAPEAIDLRLFIPQSPINDLAVYLPEVFREASGTIKADLNLSGKPHNPEISGELQMKADELALKNMRKPLTKVDFAISTDDRIINIDRLEASLGRGKLAGNGQVNFRDGLGSITANISGQKLDLSFMNLEINNASATLDVTGDLYNPVLKGKLFVPRGRFNITTDLLAKRKPMDLFFNTLNYHFDIEVPRNFWIKSSFLNSEMRGRFSITGDLENINLDGGISCVQGKLYFKQRQFQIETGEIKFGGIDNSFDPHIYVKSEGQIQSTKVFLTLQGRVSSFTPQIYSTPPMSEGDLFALLTLGRDLSTAMQSDSKELFETEILEGLKNSYISALIGSTISSALNLDELFLSSLFDRTSGKSRSFIRVGKYIGKNIFMAYEGSMEQGQDEAYIFEYRLPKGFVVNLEFKEPIQEQRIGVRYDWKFW